MYNTKIIQEDMKTILGNEYISFSKLENKTVLITGANGMLASYLVYMLLYLNDQNKYHIKIKALVRNEERAKQKFQDVWEREDLEFLVQDVCEPLQIEEDVHYIVHAAGAASPRFIVNDPVGILKANTIGTFNVLEFAKKKQVENVLYTSTREIYGAVEDTDMITEDIQGKLDPMDGRSCYPESKRVAETIFKSYLLQYGIPFEVVRIAHVYGPGMEINNDGRVMSDFIHDAVNGQDIVMKSTGEAVRAFCYITDAIAAMFAVMLDGVSGEAYNIADETQPVMIREAATLLTELFPERGIKAVFQKSDDTTGYCTYKRVGLSTEKVETLGWKPSTKLRDGLKRTVLSFEK